jgi:hypothetical protein
MGMCGGNNDAGWQARQLENERVGRIAQGQIQIDKTFGRFDDKFYNQRQQDYTNFAMPQLYGQFAQANKQGKYGLASRGLSGSGAADAFGSQLGKEMDTQKQGIVDVGIGQAQQLRKDVEGQRSGLLSQLTASGDSTQAAQQALATAGTYSLPSAYAPIGNLLSTFTSLYANNQLNKAYSPQQYSTNYGLSGSTLGNKSFSIKN